MVRCLLPRMDYSLPQTAERLRSTVVGQRTPGPARWRIVTVGLEIVADFLERFVLVVRARTEFINGLSGITC